MDRFQNTDLSSTPPEPTTGETGYLRQASPGNYEASAVYAWYFHMLVEELRNIVLANPDDPTPVYTKLDQVQESIAAQINAATPDGTETVKGLVRFATEEEHTAGASTVLACNPAGVKALIESIISTDVPAADALVTGIAAAAYNDYEAAVLAVASIANGLTTFDAGNVVHMQHLGEVVAYSSSATLTANAPLTFRAFRKGTFRFSFEYSAPGDSDSGFMAQVFVNGEGKGSLLTCTSDGWAAVTPQDIAVNAGDLVELRTRYKADATAAGYNKIRKFKVSASVGLPGGAVIDY